MLPNLGFHNSNLSPLRASHLPSILWLGRAVWYPARIWWPSKIKGCTFGSNNKCLMAWARNLKSRGRLKRRPRVTALGWRRYRPSFDWSKMQLVFERINNSHVKLGRLHMQGTHRSKGDDSYKQEVAFMKPQWPFLYSEASNYTDVRILGSALPR